jgi:hypothetical protein
MVNPPPPLWVLLRRKAYDVVIDFGEMALESP